MAIRVLPLIFWSLVSMNSRVSGAWIAEPHYEWMTSDNWCRILGAIEPAGAVELVCSMCNSEEVGFNLNLVRTFANFRTMAWVSALYRCYYLLSCSYPGNFLTLLDLFVLGRFGHIAKRRVSPISTGPGGKWDISLIWRNKTAPGIVAKTISFLRGHISRFYITPWTLSSCMYNRRDLDMVIIHNRPSKEKFEPRTTNNITK